MDTVISFYILRANPKSRLFQNVKEVSTNGIPEIGQNNAIFWIPEIRTIFT